MLAGEQPQQGRKETPTLRKALRPAVYSERNMEEPSKRGCMTFVIHFDAFVGVFHQQSIFGYTAVFGLW